MKKDIFKFVKVRVNYLLLGSILVLSGCASYKSKPLDDFTEDNTACSVEQID